MRATSKQFGIIKETATDMSFVKDEDGFVEKHSFEEALKRQKALTRRARRKRGYVAYILCTFTEF